MKIAIIDSYNQDIGLSILFPEADYYIKSGEIICNAIVDKSCNMKPFNIEPKKEWDNIIDTNYDYLFIIIALYDAKPGTQFFKQNIYDVLQNEIKIIKNNNFKKVFVFDIYDYDYDPNEILNNVNVTFFKRNYNKTKKYKENVIPFPFIMFGETSLVEKMLNNNLNNNHKIDRIFFTGTLFQHNDDELKYYRNRMNIYNKIKKFIYNPGNLPYDMFIKQIHDSKFGLDLNGVGEPNKRTFEILSQGSLRIGEYNDLKWPFEEEFSEETIFKNADDFINKITMLSNDELYNKCLENQNSIFRKYFNINWLREYVEKYL